ncbi:cell division protein ZapA [Microbaculum marinum]|uniref:Cell division protein ZapA n=1 Tax=Microbaculum marinum TaxID=1764581 RepID=A0AAW9S1L9_9HYPH
MPQVTVSINGRVYRMGCDEGQEHVLAELARDIDRRIEAYKSSFGEVGDMRLMLMAAMELGDELGDTKRRLQELEAEVESLRDARSAILDKVSAAQDSVAGMLDQAAARIEKIAAMMNGAEEGSAHRGEGAATESRPDPAED